MKKYFLVLAVLLITIKVNAQNVNETSDFGLLVSYLEGNFNTLEQSKTDTNYYHIVLHMKSIWNERSDGIWMYVEQAVGWKQEKPYRQRIYRLTESDDNTFISEVYTFENPLKYAGAWKDINLLADLTPEKLSKKEGCTVLIKKTGDETFAGGTKGKECQSDLSGAKYASSTVTIKPDMFISWDRGFDENDVQVWGAETGGYIFKKE